jgi:hypothetical protein
VSTNIPSISKAASLLRSAARPTVASSIEQLRQRVADHSGPDITLDILEKLVVSAARRDDIQAMATHTGLDVTDVAATVSDLGTWLSHVHGAPPIRLVRSGDFEQPTLFVLPKANEVQRLELPAGFSPRELGRDIRASLAAVMSRQPDRDELQRFTDRNHMNIGPWPVATFEIIAGVAFFARLGRLDDLATISPDSVSFNERIVKAYDILDVARQDGLAALADVLVSPADTEDLVTPMARARVLFDPQLVRLARLVDRLDTSDEVPLLFERERQSLAHRIITATRQWVPAGVHDLDDAQVRRIAAGAGVALERDRHVENETRDRLVALGREADADVLVPTAMDAIAAGAQDEFWQWIEQSA